MVSSFQQFPEVFLSTAEIATQIHRAVKQGDIRKLHGRIYTRNLRDDPGTIVRRNLWPVVGLLCPNAVISHRTALEMRPTDSGTVFVSGPYDRRIQLPSLRIRQIRGPGKLDGDASFVQSLSIASQARAFLEVLKTKAIRGADSPGLPRNQVEMKLEAVIRLSGEDHANRLRDSARSLLDDLGAQAAYKELDGIIGALLRTRDSELSAPSALARAAGFPYDPFRSELFSHLHAALSTWPATNRSDLQNNIGGFANLAFIDAYFSNFIEGTEFEIEEAIDIVFNNRIPSARPEDAHDILGTFRLVGSLDEMSKGAVTACRDAGEFTTLLKLRHATIMGGRPDKNPGVFKTRSNRAGQTVFVDPELVEGTLRHGWELLKSLSEPFCKAAFVMFLVAEVHPFDDGNGRLARAMMNAELISGLQKRILIPTVYREDYLLALRALSRDQRAEPMLRMLDRAQDFTSRIDFADLHHALGVLQSCRAFESDTDTILRMPNS
jgi:hypothetical protein